MTATTDDDAGAAIEGARARDEALGLVTDMERQLAQLTSFVAAERLAVERGAPSPKHLARLRLVGDDVASAARLSRHAVTS
jgi:hypothetical protein